MASNEPSHFAKPFLLLTLVLTTAAVIAAIYYIMMSQPYQVTYYEVKEIDMFLNVESGRVVGMNTRNDAVYFGTIMPGGSGTREVIIYNNNNTEAHAMLSASGELAKWVYVSSNDFYIPPQESRVVKVHVNVPEDAKEGDYKGVLKITLERSYRILQSGMLTAGLAVNIINSGYVNVIVQDSANGAKISGASVAVYNSSSALVETGTTSSNGRWDSSAHLAGTYRVDITKSGYNSYSNSSVVIAANETTLLTANMQATVAVSAGGEGGGGGGGEGAEYATGLRFVEYPKIINISPMQTKIYTIIVENTGTEKVQNVAVSVIGGPLKFEVIPANVPVLYTKERKTFIATVYAPSTITPAQYPLVLKISGKGVFYTKNIALIISKAEVSIEKPEINLGRKSEIEGLYDTLSKIRKEVEWVKSKGKDVSTITTLLDKAKESLDNALTSWEQYDYKAAGDHFEIARSYIQNAVSELSGISIAQPERTSLVFMISAGIVGITVLVVVVYVRSYAKLKKIYRAKMEALKPKELTPEKKAEKEKLLKQLESLKEGYRLGYIKKETYSESIRKIEEALKKINESKK